MQNGEWCNWIHHQLEQQFTFCCTINTFNNCSNRDMYVRCGVILFIISKERQRRVHLISNRFGSVAHDSGNRVDTWAHYSIAQWGAGQHIGWQLNGSDGSDRSLAFLSLVSMMSSIHKHLSDRLISGAFQEIAFVPGEVIVLHVKDERFATFGAALIVYEQLTLLMC